MMSNLLNINGRSGGGRGGHEVELQDGSSFGWEAVHKPSIAHPDIPIHDPRAIQSLVRTISALEYKDPHLNPHSSNPPPAGRLHHDILSHRKRQIVLHPRRMEVEDQKSRDQP